MSSYKDNYWPSTRLRSIAYHAWRSRRRRRRRTWRPWSACRLLGWPRGRRIGRRRHMCRPQQLQTEQIPQHALRLRDRRTDCEAILIANCETTQRTTARRGRHGQQANSLLRAMAPVPSRILTCKPRFLVGKSTIRKSGFELPSARVLSTTPPAAMAVVLVKQVATQIKLLQSAWLSNALLHRVQA